MPRSRQKTFPTASVHKLEQGSPMRTTRPATPYQALMEAPPHAEPEVSTLEYDAMTEDGTSFMAAYQEALALLTPRQRTAWQDRVEWGRSYQEMANEYGLDRSTWYRAFEGALVKLQTLLGDHPNLDAWLEKGD